MKQIITTFAFCFILIISKANPIYMPIVYMEYFFFDENQQWSMYMHNSFEVDSISISSSTGSSICRKDAEQRANSVYINDEILNSDIIINPLGDSVTISTYGHGYNGNADSIFETFVFGNYPNATLPAPSKGQIVIRHIPDINESSCYYLQDSNEKSSGLLHGKIYDNKSQLLTTGSFNISPIPISSQGENTIDVIHINEDGTFSTSLLSINYNLNSINNCIRDNWDDYFYYRITNSLEIEPINISMVPDTTIEMDIHLIDEYVGVNTLQLNTTDLINIFPNPITDSYLQYEIVTPVKSTQSFIIVYNLQGKKLWQCPVVENTGSLALPSNISNGKYLLQLWMNGKAYQSKQFNVNR